MTFLEKLTEHIYRKHGDDISNVCFVLPNRRAGLYLKKYLAQRMDKAVWAPPVFSIEDFVCHVTGLEIADTTTLLFEFYNVYAAVEGNNAQPFDEFMNWAQTLLNDYNDSDLNLADTAELFRYLNEVKAISKWNPDGSPLTVHEKGYLKFFNSLSNYYKSFTQVLLEKGTGFQGLIYKKAAEKVEAYSSETTFSNIVFAGFNALTKAEEKIIKELLNSKKAEIFWDADSYYVNNKIHEAGFFIRKYREEWGLKDFNSIEDNFATGDKNITITGVPMRIGQTGLAGQLLSEMNDKHVNSENTALVLADESLLTPMLYSIPENVSDINITMGYPLSGSAVHSFFMSIFTLHENSARYSGNSAPRFFQKDILTLFNHPCFRMVCNSNPSLSWLTAFTEKVKKSNKIFYQQADILQEMKNPVISSIFNNASDNPLALTDTFTSLTGIIRDTLIAGKKVEKKNQDIDLEYLFIYAVIITKVKTLIKEYSHVKDIKTLHKIFSGLADTATIPFFGEPLKGLQIMGMLETRSLDFENIILLSVNENILPAGKSQNSFIPHDIRQETGLSTYRHKESIFAYHFYRLLQRAKNIHIVYNTRQDDFGSGEKSRFISQITEELPKYNPNIKIVHKLLVSEIKPSGINNAISAEKTEEIMKELHEMAGNGFSPSAFNAYICCPLSFYFQYVIKPEEAVQAAETVDAATMGSVIHYTIHKLYEPLKGNVLLSSHIKKMLPLAEKLIAKGFEKHYPDGGVDSGKNLLIAKVVMKFVYNFLDSETAFLDQLSETNQTLSIVALEEKCEKTINLSLQNAENITVKIKGFIDRIDSIGGKIRIIDYKTGIVKKENLKFAAWENLFNKPEYAKALQLLLYSNMYCKDNIPLNLNAGIISLRSLSKGFIPVICPGSENSNINIADLEKLETFLISLISEIFNNLIPFTQTNDLAMCRNCAYCRICNR